MVYYFFTNEAINNIKSGRCFMEMALINDDELI